MAHRSEMSKSIRIRTGGGKEWRYDAIQGATDYYEVNKSNAAAFACDDVVGFVDAIEDLLARDDLTAKQARARLPRQSTITPELFSSI